MANLADLLENTSTKYPARTAIVSADLRLTYTELDESANQVANLLAARGIRPGDKVALSCPNLPCFSIVYYGILKVGATVVPLNILLKAREIAYHLADSDAKAYVAFDGSPNLPLGTAARTAFEETPGCELFLSLGASPGTALPWAADQPHSFDTVDTDDDDTAVILYTSGTTGHPKGAELRHRNLRDNALATKHIFGVSTEDPDTFLCVLPLFHSFGQTAIQNTAIAFGGTIVMQPRFDATTALDLMLAHKVTFFAGVPTMYWGLLRALDDTPDIDTVADTLRVAASGGAALPAEIHKEFRERFGVTILEGYGLSETSPLASFSTAGEQPRVGSIGRPLPGIEMKLINDDWTDLPQDPQAVGEIAIKGHNVMKGYYKRPEATAEAIRDGWFRSGDLATKDNDGFYYIVDRAKDLIIRGGYNVYPRELEEALITHPAVALVAVIGIPHPSHGEEIKAVVVKHKDHDEVTEDDIVAWAKERLAAYKYPRIVEFRDSLPMTATGKILKREI